MVDVIPGNPAGIRDLARHWTQQGEAADSASSTLGSAKNDIEGGALRLKGDFAPKIRDAIGDLPGELRKLAQGYRGCGRALDTFATKLSDAQVKSRRARDDWDAASQSKRNAEYDLDTLAPGWDAHAQSPTGLRAYLADKPEPVMQAATRRESAVRDVDLATSLARQAAALRGDAERECVHEIKTALKDSGLKNRSWYQKVGDYLKESFTTWDGFVKLCENVALVLGVIALFLSGPLALIVGAVLLIAAAVAVADKLMKLARGEIGWGELAFELGMVVLARFGGRALGPAFRRLANSKAVKGLTNQARKGADRLANRLNLGDRARNLANRADCTVTGHPVDVATGKVFTNITDLELRGPVPFAFERVWFSTSTYLGPLGHGWHHPYDAALYADSEALLYRTPDGRIIDLMLLYPGSEYYDRQERLVVSRDESGYRIVDAGGVIRRFAPLSRAAIADVAVVHVLREVVGRNGHRISLAYDERGLLTEIVDSGGRELQFEHDDLGRIVTFTAPHPDLDGERYAVARYTYDDVGNLSAMTDALGHQIRYEYAGHLLVREIDRTGLSFYFEYDAADERARCLRTWGDGGIYDRTLSYEPGVTVEVDSLGNATRHEHEAGLVVCTRDALGGETRTEYEYQQPVHEMDALGRATILKYDYRGNLALTTTPDGVTMLTEYDDRDLLLAVIDSLGGRWAWAYDDHGLATQRRDPVGRTTRFEHRDGLLSAVTDPADGVTRFSYDDRGSLTTVSTPDGVTTTWGCDALGRPVTVIDPLGNSTVRRFDLLGNIVEVELPDGNRRTLSYDGEGNLLRAVDRLTEVDFTYQGVGRLASRSQAGTTVRFEYDTEEQLTGLVNEQGRVYGFDYGPTGEMTAERGFDDVLRLYERDLLGRPVSVRRASGTITRYSYDDADRVTAVSHSDGTVSQFSFRSDGAMTSAVNADLSVTFDHDELGRVTREIQGEHWVLSEYDALGARTRLRSSFGVDQVIERDAGGNVVGLSSDRFQARFVRDEMGQELSRELPGGVQARWHRDRQGRPLRHELTTSNGTIRDRSYDWDVDGRLRGVVDALAGPIHYRHDPLGHLMSAAHPDGQIDLRMPDAVSNLFRTEDRSDREFGPAGQLLTATDAQGRRVSYRYDPEGNLLSKQASDGETWGYRWRADGNLGEVTRPDGSVVSFGYDALGRRVSKTYRGQTTRWVWDGDVPLHEWVEGELVPAEPSQPAPSADGVAAQREALLGEFLRRGPPERGRADAPITWLFEPESFVPLARVVDGRCESIIADHVGTPVAMLDEAGSLTWSGELSAWGELRPGSGQPRENPSNRWAMPFRWPGQYEDAETGLYYNRFRYYDPEGGQYTSQDPIGLAGGSALYGYVRDPSGWVDPLGLACTPTAGGGWRNSRGQFARPDARDIAAEAKRRQGLNPSAPLPQNFKEKFTHGRFDYEVRAHTPPAGAPPGSNSASGPTFRVARRRQGTNSSGQGYGWEYADDAGQWFHTKFLKTANSDPLAAQAADATHIPLT